MDPDAEPSPMKNFVGGTGCGCGCIGMLTVFGGALTIGLLIPFRFFPPEWGGTLGMLSAVGLVIGILLTLLGGFMWLASLFID